MAGAPPRRLGRCHVPGHHRGLRHRPGAELPQHLPRDHRDAGRGPSCGWGAGWGAGADVAVDSRRRVHAELPAVGAMKSSVLDMCLAALLPLLLLFLIPLLVPKKAQTEALLEDGLLSHCTIGEVGGDPGSGTSELQSTGAAAGGAGGGTTSDGQWSVRKTFVEVLPAQRRASSEPPQNRTTSHGQWSVRKTFVEVEEDEEDEEEQDGRLQHCLHEVWETVEQLKEQITAAEVAEAELKAKCDDKSCRVFLGLLGFCICSCLMDQEQLLVEEQYAVNISGRGTVERLEKDLNDVMEKYQAACWYYDAEAERCNRAQMLAGTLQAQPWHRPAGGAFGWRLSCQSHEEIDEKTRENEQLEEECEELKAEVESVKALTKKNAMEMKRVATPMKLVTDQTGDSCSDPSVHRCLGVQLRQAEQTAAEELEDKEALMQKKLKQNEESLLLQELALKQGLEALAEGPPRPGRLDKAAKNKQEKEKRLKHWADKLQTARMRKSKAESKASRAESKAVAMQSEIETLTSKVQEAQDSRTEIESDLAAARAFRDAWQQHLRMAYVVLISLLCVCLLLMWI
eukprot:Skav228650  [mRNA]  locus=scaffold2369:77378:86748:+ [translate_table: standard]